MLKVKVFTLYPDLFPGTLDIGLYKKARQKKVWDLKIVNIRDFAKDKQRKYKSSYLSWSNLFILFIINFSYFESRHKYYFGCCK